MKNKNELPENSENTGTGDPQIQGYFINLNILKIAFKWKLHLMAVLFMSFIVAVVFSGSTFIKPKYNSVGLVYPSNISTYSDESETEQMLQWFESRDIVDSMINKFDLLNHYNININDKYFKSRIYKEFHNNVTISRTKYESVEIEITDTDPNVACDMVNAMIDFYNKKVSYIHKEKYLEVLIIEESRLMEKKKQQDSLMKVIKNIRTKYELIDYGIQTNEVTRGYLGTFDGSNMANVNLKEVERIKHNIENKGDSLLLITNQISSVSDAYNKYKISYEDALRNVNKVQTYVNIITYPYPADKKSYPIRWVIVVFTTFFSLLTAFMTIFILENFASIKRNFQTFTIS